MLSQKSLRHVHLSHAAQLLQEGAAAKKQDIITELNRRQVQFSEKMSKNQLRELLKFSMELVLKDAPGIPVKRSTVDGADLKPVIMPSSYADGGRYDGELKEGVRCGHGIHTLPDGGFYEGQWEDDQKNGKGLLRSANGNKYDGEWKDDKKHGHGVTTLVNGSQHSGEWKNDKRDGQGMLINSTGKYDGMWMDDMKHGYGVFTWNDGLQYHGEFFRDNVFGKGTYCRIIDDFTIEHNGHLYRTLGDHRHADPIIKFEATNMGGDGAAVEVVGIMRELPQGWQLAPNCSDSMRVCAEHNWQSIGLVLGDGSAIYTARATQLKLNPGDQSNEISFSTTLVNNFISPSAYFSGHPIDLFPHKTALKVSFNTYGVTGLLLCEDILLRKRLAPEASGVALVQK
jgi:hypothetical protein